jgi:hypothetical protein
LKPFFSQPLLPRSGAGRLRLAALAVLAVGWLLALTVYLASAPAADDGGAAAVDTSTEMLQVERLGGKAAVLTLQFNRWLQTLWHGRRLAGTLAVLSTLMAWLCLHIAELADGDED